MYILAFETSCDDTSIAIFKDNKLLSMFTGSQIKIHNKTNGVVPEVAAREHANTIFEILTIVLQDVKLSLNDINYIAVTTHPGLLPSILTGTTVASTISLILQKKIIPINHIEAHIFANFLDREEKDIDFPLVCLSVSGGHNDIYYMKDMWNLEKIGYSGDDASGEAFDKVAKMMGLGYPGGPIISKLAGEYLKPIKKKEKLFPRILLNKNEFDFSFSGLKSSVKRYIDKKVEKKGKLTIKDKREIAYEFEEAIIEVLAYKIISAAKEKKVKTILLTGGVSANNRLREEVLNLSQKEGIKCMFPLKNIYCTDNASMVGINAYYRIKYNKFENIIGVVRV